MKFIVIIVYYMFEGSFPSLGCISFAICSHIVHMHVIQYYDYKLHKSSIEYKLQQDHNINVEYHHVKAHQDEKPLRDKEGKPIPLTAAACLNIYCDQQAGKERTHPPEGYEPKKIQK